jgi:spore coat protein JB
MEDARTRMLEEIMALDFTLVDLNLYLNTHPYDQKAMTAFVNSSARAKMLRDKFEKTYGPITASSSNTYPWPWINNPWPWDKVRS